MRFQATRQIASFLLLAISSTAIAALAVAFAPLAVAVAATEQPCRRRQLAKLVALGASLIASLWRLSRGEPRRPWHPCARCSFPIESPSKARYCSPGCRRHGTLERRATGGDERAQQQLRRLTRRDTLDPASVEIPF